MKRMVSLCVLWLVCICITCEGPVVFGHPWPKLLTISGRVIDQETKTPIIAELSINGEGVGSFNVYTDSAGKFSVGVPETTQCRIVAHAQGFDPKEEVIIISEPIHYYIEVKMVPVVKLTLDGTVFGDSGMNEKPLDATLSVYLNSDFNKEDSAIVADGKYTESFTNFGWYIIDFSAPGFANARDTIWVMNNQRKTVHKDYHLIPLDSKLSVPLTNIYFNFGSATLDSKFFTELNYLSDFLLHHPGKRVEIIGFTDNAGPEEYNLTLSEIRAREIANYLLERKVKNDQLIIKGFGEKKPIDANASVRGRANNRRVELLLTDVPVLDEVITEKKLENIHFDFGTAVIKPGSFEELNQLAKFFNTNLSSHLEIIGHTDNTGPEGYNNYLSQVRAQTVAGYLKSKGVKDDQLLAKGYGETKPIDSNTTAVGKANNRRVELIVLNNK